MKSASIYHIWLDLKSSAVVLGTTKGELYAYFHNKPPAKLNLAQIDEIQKYKLYGGSYDATWFGGPLAEQEPIIIHTPDKLAAILKKCLLPSANPVIEYFMHNLPKNNNLGGIIEVIRLINYQFPRDTRELPVLLERLSNRGFFKLA